VNVAARLQQHELREHARMAVRAGLRRLPPATKVRYYSPFARLKRQPRYQLRSGTMLRVIAGSVLLLVSSNAFAQNIAACGDPPPVQDELLKGDIFSPGSLAMRAYPVRSRSNARKSSPATATRTRHDPTRTSSTKSASFSWGITV
jgi:hypothetical protein